MNSCRNQLHKLWDACLYSSQQRNEFNPLHSIDFTEELLEEHELEISRVEKYFNDNKELFNKIYKRQEIWNKLIELERRAKDPSRLLNARGKSLLMEEKERNLVNKAFPQIEHELEVLIGDWESVHGEQFLVGGVSFKKFIEVQKETHVKELKAEKRERDEQKKLQLLQESRYGAKPCIPAKMKELSGKPAKMVNSVKIATMRSPRAGRVAKGTSPRIGGKPPTKNRKVLGKQEKKMKRGIQEDNSLIVKCNSTVGRRKNESVSSTVADYDRFKQGNILSSTVAPISDTSSVSCQITVPRMTSRLGGESSKPTDQKKLVKRPFVI